MLSTKIHGLIFLCFFAIINRSPRLHCSAAVAVDRQWLMNHLVDFGKGKEVHFVNPPFLVHLVYTNHSNIDRKVFPEPLHFCKIAAAKKTLPIVTPIYLKGDFQHCWNQALQAEKHQLYAFPSYFASSKQLFFI